MSAEMNYLTHLVADIEERIDDIRAIGDVNEDVVRIAVRNLESIKKDFVETGKFQGILQKIDRQLLMYRQVARIPELQSKLPVIREQMVVLIIGALEVFIADVFRSISNNNPEYLHWNDPKEKVSFDPAMLADNFTLGDAIIGHLKNRGYSFQDLQSSLKAFETYFGVRISLEQKVRDELILGAAYRHVIVHNRSKIDSAFINQIRSTEFAGHLKKNRKVDINDEYVRSLGDATKHFARDIAVTLMQRDH